MTMSTVISLVRTITPVALALAVLGAPDRAGAGQLIGDTQPKISGSALVKELRKGGYIVFFRHGATTDFREKDLADSELDRCELQRNLSEAGRALTRKIGESFRQLQIPVGASFSSPYCRAMETATQIVGRAQKSKFLYFATNVRTSDRASVTAQLLDMLGTPPAAGTNTVMVSHTANLQEAVGIWPKPEAVAHVFKPGSEGNFTYVGMMAPDGWFEEAARAGGKSGWWPAKWFGDNK